MDDLSHFSKPRIIHAIFTGTVMEHDNITIFQLCQNTLCKGIHPPVAKITGPVAESHAIHSQLEKYAPQPGTDDPSGRPESQGLDTENLQALLRVSNLIFQPAN